MLFLMVVSLSCNSTSPKKSGEEVKDNVAVEEETPVKQDQQPRNLTPMKLNASGDLNVTVFVTDSPKFIKEWVSTPASHSPVIKRIKSAKPEQMVHAGFAVTGFALDNSSKTNFVVGINIQDPSGNVIFEEPNWDVHIAELSSPKGIVMADPVLDFTVEDSDPLGTYIISAMVKDNIGGKEHFSSSELTISK